MRFFGEIVGMTFILILVYLFLANYRASVAVIDAIAGNAVRAIRTLQGR